MNLINIQLGLKLNYFSNISDKSNPITSEQLAKLTSKNKRMTREWVN